MGQYTFFPMIFPYSALFPLVSLYLIYSPKFPEEEARFPTALPLAGAHAYA